MLKRVCLIFCLIQLYLPLSQSFNVTFRKNITVTPGTYFYLNHSYIKEQPNNMIDYIDTVTTHINISLTYPYDNTPFDIFVLNQTEFDCYLTSQNSATPGTVPVCSYDFLNSNQKSFLLTTSLNNTLYSANIDDLSDSNYIIVIDNTQFPKSLAQSPYYLGAYQPLDLNVDVYVKTSYDLSSLYYQVFLALLCVTILFASGLVIFFIVYYYKYKVLQKKSNKLKKIMQADSF